MAIIEVPNLRDSVPPEIQEMMLNPLAVRSSMTDQAQYETLTCANCHVRQTHRPYLWRWFRYPDLQETLLICPACYLNPKSVLKEKIDVSQELFGESKRFIFL